MIKAKVDRYKEEKANRKESHAQGEGCKQTSQECAVAVM